MENKISAIIFLIVSIFIFSGCSKTNPSGGIKRALVKKSGNWEVTQIDEYYTNLYYPEFEFSKDLGIVGTYFFDKDDAPSMAGDFGTWTPIGGSKRDLVYQVADIQKNLTFTIWYWENNATTTHEGYEIHDDWTKTEIVIENSTTIYGDTIIRHFKTLRSLGN